MTRPCPHMAGNNGHAIEPSKVDAQKFSLLSLGNEGFNDQTLDSKAQCKALNGTVDCTGKTVWAFGENVDATQVRCRAPLWWPGAIVGSDMDLRGRDLV
jgi:hypothetical protein